MFILSGCLLAPELSMNSSVTFIKTGKSENPQVRLVTLQTENPFTPTLEGSISVTNMGQAEGIAHMVAEDNHYRGEWYRFSSSAAAQLMIRRIRETLDTYKLICQIKKSNITCILNNIQVALVRPVRHFNHCKLNVL